MPTDAATLRKSIDKSLGEKNAADAVCYLAELCAQSPDDRLTRTALAITLGDAGNPVGALQILRALADNLAQRGQLLPAMVVVRQGLEHAPNDASLLSTLKRLHVSGVRAKANMATPPALKPQKTTSESVSADTLLALVGDARLERIAQLGSDFPAPSDTQAPHPMPLFSELDEGGFLEVVKLLRYHRFAKGAPIMKEGDAGTSLMVLATGQVHMEKGGVAGAAMGPGSILGEVALITGATRAASVIADEPVEVFELTRTDVELLAKSKPDIAEALIAYCRKRLIANLLLASPLFKRFDDFTRDSLVDHFKRTGFNPGQALVEQGQPGTGLYVVVTGEVQLVDDRADSKVLATLGPGDVVGEMSLLRDQPMNAKAVAVNRVGALFLPMDEFRQVLEQHKDVKKYLESLPADSLSGVEQVIDADDLTAL